MNLTKCSFERNNNDRGKPLIVNLTCTVLSSKPNRDTTGTSEFHANSIKISHCLDLQSAILIGTVTNILTRNICCSDRESMSRTAVGWDRRNVFKVQESEISIGQEYWTGARDMRVPRLSMIEWTAIRLWTIKHLFHVVWFLMF